MLPLRCRRLFVAIELPEPLRKTLADLDPGLPGVRWLEAANLHLTLSFLGDAVTADEETRLLATLETVAVAPFFLPLEGLGSFGRPHRPTVLWVGVGRGHPHLFALHKRVQDAVLAAGLEPDLRAFKPHVTLARCGPGASSADLARFVKTHAGFEAGIFPVKSFALYSSQLAADAAIHTREAEFPLR